MKTETKPFIPLACRIVGHNWIAVNIDDEVTPGFRVTRREWMRYCRRCGQENPNCVAIEDTAPTTPQP